MSRCYHDRATADAFPNTRRKWQFYLIISVKEIKYRNPPSAIWHARFTWLSLPKCIALGVMVYLLFDDMTKFSLGGRIPVSSKSVYCDSSAFRYLKRWEGLRKCRLCSQTMYRHGNLSLRAVCGNQGCVCVEKGQARTHIHTHALTHVERLRYVRAFALFVLLHDIWTNTI